MRDSLEFRSMKAMGYLNRIIYLLFYISTIISLYEDKAARNSFNNPIEEVGLLIIGFVIFSLSFIGNFYQYYQDRKPNQPIQWY